MMMVIFFLVSLIICISTVGYGLLLNYLLKFENSNYNYGLMGLLGLFFLIIIANLIIIFFGFSFFIINKRFSLINFKLLLFIFILLFISILMAKTNEDFGYYH